MQERGTFYRGVTMHEAVGCADVAHSLHCRGHRSPIRQVMVWLRAEAKGKHN